MRCTKQVIKEVVSVWVFSKHFSQVHGSDTSAHVNKILRFEVNSLCCIKAFHYKNILVERDSKELSGRTRWALKELLLSTVSTGKESCAQIPLPNDLLRKKSSQRLQIQNSLSWQGGWKERLAVAKHTAEFLFALTRKDYLCSTFFIPCAFVHCFYISCCLNSV